MKMLIPFIVALVGSAPQAGDKDVLLAAMTDELARTVNHLQIEKHDKPYYVSYSLSDSSSLNMSASFGAMTADRINRQRTSTVDVHVGNYSLDSGNVRSAFAFFDGIINSGSLSVDDNYDAIRHHLWLQTDSAYKKAVQNLEQKKSSNQQKNMKDRPDDWTHEEPVVSIEPKETLTPDKERWKAEIKNLSAVFKGYPKIRESSVVFSEDVTNRYFVNSEGSRGRTPIESYTITFNATAQASDGMKVEGSSVVAVTNEKKIPSEDDLVAKAKQLAELLSQSVDGKELEIYQGPVLFEGEAAGTFFSKALAPNLVAERPPESDRMMHSETLVQDRMGRRILPTFIDVVDDPTLKDASGDKLLGSYELDDQGVMAKRVVLVENGILKTLLSTRLPTRKVKASNGHAIGLNSAAEISNLTVHSSVPMSREELIAKLRQLGKEEGLEYVLVVRKMGSNSRSDAFGAMTAYVTDLFSGGRSDRVDLPIAIDVSRVSVADGHEELIRPTKFSGGTMRILRDIVATGSDSQTYPLTRHNNTITTPSIIVTDVEMQESHANPDKKPILPHPYFEEKKPAAD